MTKRSVPAMIGLTIITLGIYQLYWLYATRKELKQKGADIPSFWWLLLPIVPYVLVVPAVLISAYSVQPVDQNDPSAGLLPVLIVLTFVSLLSFALYIWWWYHYSKAVESVTDGRMSFDLCFWLTIVLAFLGVNFIMPFLIQNEFNQISGQNSGSYLGGVEPPYPKI